MAGEWSHGKDLARAILHDRVARRRVIGRMLLGVLAAMAAGLWLIDGWLGAHPGWFLLWWGGCGIATCVVMLFALYDALAVIGEERRKNR